MPRRTAMCRPVSHRGIYSPDMPETPPRATGSKNSAGERARGAHRLVYTVLIRLGCSRNAESRYSEAFHSSYSRASISPFSSCARFSAHSPIAAAALRACGALGLRARPAPSAAGSRAGASAKPSVPSETASRILLFVSITNKEYNLRRFKYQVYYKENRGILPPRKSTG